MDFFITTEVVNRRYSKALKALLGLICILDILVIIVELLNNGGIGAIYIIPLIFLIPAFFRIGEKRYLADVLCKVTEEELFYDLVMSNVIIDKKDVLNRKYKIVKDGLSVFTNGENGRIAIIGSGTILLLNQQNQTVFEQDFREETIELNVKKTTFEELNNYFMTYIAVRI